MILTPAQMKSIADKGRALPDEILAPLVLDVVLGSAPTSTETAPRAGETRAYVKMADRIDGLIAFLNANPGSPMRSIAPALGIARSHACIVVRQALKAGRVEARGVFNHTRYFVPQTKPAAPGERKRGAGKAQAPQKRVDAAVVYVRTHPGSRMRDIAPGIGASPSSARMAIVRAIQDGLVELRGQRVDAMYFPTREAVDAQPPTAQTTDAKPAVLLVEQRIDGENQQRLVRVERRRGIAANETPKTAQQRRIAVVEYARKNPGASLTDIAHALGCDKQHAQYAIGLARQAGEIRMDGELGKARYYPRGYTNGAASTGSV